MKSIEAAPVVLAHAGSSIVPASAVPETAADAEALTLDGIAPCLVGATSDDRVAYELGTWFRPASYGTVTLGLVTTILAALLFRKVGRMRYAVLSAALGVLIVGGGMVIAHRQIPPAFNGKTHEHADLAIVVDGKPFDLTSERFQSKEGHVLSDFTHLHDGNGTVVHKHAMGVTWGYFFWTIGVPLRGDCMVGPDGVNRCERGATRWVAVVNGQVTENLRDLEVRDLDRVMLWYGDEPTDHITGHFEQIVTRDACIASGTCPERGKPPVESCAG